MVDSGFVHVRNVNLNGIRIWNQLHTFNIVILMHHYHVAVVLFGGPWWHFGGTQLRRK